VYYPNYVQNRKRPSKSVPFMGYVYSPKRCFLSELNPIKFAADKLFERSLFASRRRLLPVSPELEKYTKEVPLAGTYAWDINPDNREKYVMILHGTGQNISNLQLLYKAIINQTDYAILAPEYRGFGKNKPSNISPETFLEDTTNALDYLKDKKSIKLSNITLIGHSFGGFAASQLANKNQGLEHLILVSTFDSLSPNIINFNKATKGQSSKMLELIFKHIDFLKKSLDSIFSSNHCIKKLKVPVSILHSVNDKLVNVKSSENLAGMCKNLKGAYYLPTGGHAMDKTKIDTLVKILNENKN
jgi:esterase/lipase